MTYRSISCIARFLMYALCTLSMCKLAVTEEVGGAVYSTDLDRDDHLDRAPMAGSSGSLPCACGGHRIRGFVGDYVSNSCEADGAAASACYSFTGVPIHLHDSECGPAIVWSRISRCETVHSVGNATDANGTVQKADGGGRHGLPPALPEGSGGRWRGPLGHIIWWTLALAALACRAVDERLTLRTTRSGGPARRANGRAEDGKKRKRSPSGGDRGNETKFGRYPWEKARRWALEALRIGGRRVARTRRRGLTKALRLGGTSAADGEWFPWKCEEDADEVGDIVRRRATGEVTAAQIATIGPHGEGGGRTDGAQQMGGVRHDIDTSELIDAYTSGGNRWGNVAIGATALRVPVHLRVLLLAALLGSRIGEASHPGPTEEVHSPAPPLALVDAAWKSSIEYPPPHRDGFRDISAPGFDELRGGKGRRREEEEFQFEVESANTTGWGPLQRRLMTTSSHALLAQETWILPSLVAHASSWARRHGWDSAWSPAVLGPGGGASGGVAVFVRSEIGLRYPTHGTHILEEGRAVAAITEPPGHRPILLTSVYLRDGKEMAADNRRTLARIGDCAEAHEGECLPLVGGDFQCHPGVVEDSGFPHTIRGRILSASSARGTFRTAAVSSTLDYFVAAAKLADVIENVELVERSGIKGHVPIRLTFAARPIALKSLAFRRPPDLELERLYGPLPPPPSWDDARKSAVEALRLATTNADARSVQQAIDVAYYDWCQRAEQEIVGVTGSRPKKMGLRGLKPRLKWASALPEKVVRGAPSAAAVATHLKGYVAEFIRIIGQVQVEAGAGFYRDLEPIGCNRPHGATFATPVRGGYGGPTTSGASGAPIRGGRPRPPTDLKDCGEVVSEIIGDINVTDGQENAVEIGDVDGKPMRDVVKGIAERVRTAVNQSQELGYYSDEPLEQDLRSLASALAEVEKKAERERDDESRKKWKAWLEEDWHRGARHAHAATKAPTEWRPTVTTREDGTKSAAPSAILDGMRKKYKGYWSATEDPFEYSWGGNCPPLPRLSPGELREASLSFARGTAMTYDGWHVRHLGLLADDGLAVLAILLETVERTSRWPSQISVVTTPMISKPKGGHRLVGKLAALYRVWAKARRPHAEKWESDNSRPFFATAAGSGPIDAVYRQALRQEAAKSTGQAAITILEDMESFYETINREILIDEARRLGYPTCLIRASLAAYAAPRMITFGSAVAKELHAQRGIIAGCSFATTLVKIFYIRRLDEMVKEIPRNVKIDGYIDDLALSAEGPRGRIAKDIIRAYVIMVRILTEELGCSLAPSKAAVVASDRELGRTVARAIGRGDVYGTSAVNLGTDVTAGARRKHLKKSSKRHARMRNALGRGRRLWAIGKVLGRRALRIFTSGLAPSMCYGSEIWGASDSEIGNIRRLAARAMRPRSRCRSLTMVHLLHQMPTAAWEIATVVQYSRSVWRASTQREYSADREMGLTDLRRYWESVQRAIAPAAEAYRASIEKGEGRAEASVARRTWGEVRGPIGACIMTLTRLGWAMTSAFTLVDRRGVEVSLTTTAPALLRRMLIEATMDAAEKVVGARWSGKDPEFKGRRVCPDLAIKAIKGGMGSRLNAQQVAMFRAAACDGVYTRHRAAEEGYEVADECEFCGAAGDTHHHRIFCCPHTRSAVLQHVPGWLYAEGGRANPRSKFWTTGIFPHPADEWPLPAAGFDAIIVGDNHGSRGSEGWHNSEDGFGGDLFTDGSCTPSPIRGLARAGCAAIEADETGERKRGIYLAIPRHLPQTSQSGEHVGVAVARREAVRQSHIRSDCSNVVRATNATAARALAPTRAYAGIVLDKFTRLDATSKATRVSWVRAHRAASDQHDEDTRREIRANAAADHLAGEAVKLHPQPTHDQQVALNYYLKRAPLVAKAIGVALAMFPPSEANRLKRRDPPASAAEARERNVHRWICCQGIWRCECCGTWVSGGDPTTRHMTEECSGHIAHRSADAWSAMGHKIALVSGDAPFAFCSRCGAWGNRRARNLKLPCRGPTPAGAMALSRIARGRHPWRRRLAGGGDAPRTAIVVTKIFDKSAKAWEKVGGRGGAQPSKRRARQSKTPPSRGSGADGTEAAVVTNGGAGSASDGAAEKLPPFIHGDEDMFEDHDPFGHGGGLSQADGSNREGTSSGRGGACGDDVGEGHHDDSSVSDQHGASQAAQPGARGTDTGEAEGGALGGGGNRGRERIEAVFRRVKARLSGGCRPSIDDDPLQVEDVALGQLQGGGEPPSVAGLPLPQAPGFDVVPPLPSGGRGSGGPTSARGQINPLGEPAEKRGLSGADSPRCRMEGPADGLLGDVEGSGVDNRHDGGEGLGGTDVGNLTEAQVHDRDGDARDGDVLPSDGHGMVGLPTRINGEPRGQGAVPSGASSCRLRVAIHNDDPRLRAEADDHRAIHRLSRHLSLLRHGEHGRHAAYRGPLHAVRGDHAVLDHHHLRGADSLCRRYSTTVPPFHRGDAAGRGLVNLEGTPLPGTTQFQFQELHHGVDSLRNVDGNLVGGPPRSGASRGRDGNGVHGDGQRRRGRDGAPGDREGDRERRRKRRRGGGNLSTDEELERGENAGSDVAPSTLGGMACVHSSGEGDGLGSDVGEDSLTSPCVNSERRRGPGPQQADPRRQADDGQHPHPPHPLPPPHRGDGAEHGAPRDCQAEERRRGQGGEQRGGGKGHLRPEHRHQPIACHRPRSGEGRPEADDDTPIARRVQDGAREADGRGGLGSDVGGAILAPPCVHPEGVSDHRRNEGSVPALRNGVGWNGPRGRGRGGRHQGGHRHEGHHAADQGRAGVPQHNEGDDDGRVDDQGCHRDVHDDPRNGRGDRERHLLAGRMADRGRNGSEFNAVGEEGSDWFPEEVRGDKRARGQAPGRAGRDSHAPPPPGERQQLLRDEHHHGDGRGRQVHSRDQLRHYLRGLAQASGRAHRPPSEPIARAEDDSERGKKRPRYVNEGEARGAANEGEGHRQEEARRDPHSNAGAPMSRAELVRRLGSSGGGGGEDRARNDSDHRNADHDEGVRAGPVGGPWHQKPGRSSALHRPGEVASGYRGLGRPSEETQEVSLQGPHGDRRLGRGMTHHHHHDPPEHDLLDNQRHHYARHQTSPRQFRPSHHVAELSAVGAHHIGHSYYGGRGSFPAIPRTPNRAAHGQEGSR